MPFLLIILFLTIFFLTTLGGRLWCGWACPQTCFRVIYRDLIQTKLLKIRKNIRNKQKPISGNYFKRAIGVLLWGILALIAASNLLWYFVPPEDFFRYLTNPNEHKLLIGILLCTAAFLVYDVTYLAERFCVYICPYARIQSVLFDNDTIQVIYDDGRGGQIYKQNEKLGKKPVGGGECIGCEACVSICPAHIDIRKGMQLECVNCLECVDACTKVMAGFNKKSLIEWTSEKSITTKQKVKYFRFRTIAYMVILFIAIIVLGIMISKKENMLLNINRSSELYSIKVDDGKFRVENAYIFLFQNTQNSDHTYYFDLNNTDIKIIRPKKAQLVKAGEKLKVIVVLSTDKMLINSPNKDFPMKLNVTAYATDDTNIKVNRQAVFVFPRKDHSYR